MYRCGFVTRAATQKDVKDRLTFMTMTATQRAAPGSQSTETPREAPISARYHRFAGVRTRVYEVGPDVAEGRRTSASGRRASLRRGKRSSRRPLHPRFVLIHGYCDSADTWLQTLAELAAAGHSAIAIDLPGFGEADALRSGPMLPQFDAFLAAVIKEQGCRGEVVLVGNSLGGTLSLRAAQNAWLPVAGVVSIAAPGFSDSWLVRTVRRYPIPLRVYAALPVPVPGMLVRTVAGRVIPRLLYANGRDAEAREVERFTMLFPDYLSTRSRLEQARQLVEELENAYQLERVQVPLLVIACGKDRLVSVAGGRRLHTLVPHSRLMVREDWGHCPQLDSPAEMAELIAYFGAGCTRARTAADSFAQEVPTVIPVAGTEAG